MKGLIKRYQPSRSYKKWNFCEVPARVSRLKHEDKMNKNTRRALLYNFKHFVIHSPSHHKYQHQHKIALQCTFHQISIINHFLLNKLLLVKCTVKYQISIPLHFDCISLKPIMLFTELRFTPALSVNRTHNSKLNGYTSS